MPVSYIKVPEEQLLKHRVAYAMIFTLEDDPYKLVL